MEQTNVKNLQKAEKPPNQPSWISVCAMILIVVGIGFLLLSVPIKQKYMDVNGEYMRAYKDALIATFEQNHFSTTLEFRSEAEREQFIELKTQNTIYRYLNFMGQKGSVALLVIGGVLIFISPKKQKNSKGETL